MYAWWRKSPVPAMGVYRFRLRSAVGILPGRISVPAYSLAWFGYLIRSNVRWLLHFSGWASFVIFHLSRLYMLPAG